MKRSKVGVNNHKLCAGLKISPYHFLVLPLTTAFLMHEHTSLASYHPYHLALPL